MLKLNLHQRIAWSEHRSGWRYVMSLLEPYQSPEGIRTDGFIDASFGFGGRQQQQAGTIPYRDNWFGFWHHPVQIPPWLNEAYIAPDWILKSEAFRESVPFCKGIFTFSDYLASYLRDRLPVPVEVLYHPTEFTALTFDPEAFDQTKQLIQVGNWLRRLTSFYHFAAPDYQKIHLLGRAALQYFKQELAYHSETPFCAQDVTIMPFASNEAYDKLLSESIVFLDLYDSSVNNTVIECMVRDTPLVVNKLKPVIEYLGRDYPLYYEELRQVPALLRDASRIRAAHQYLKTHPVKEKLRGQYFVQSLAASPIVATDFACSPCSPKAYASA